MALVTLPGGPILWPYFPFHGLALFSATFALTAVGHKIASIFKVPRTGNIVAVSFATAFTSTGAPTVTAAIKALDAAYDPTATNYGGSTPSLASPALSTNTAYELALQGAAAAAAGDYVAALLELASGTQIDIRGVGLDDNGSVGFPFADHFTAAWARTTGSCPPIAIKYDDGTYEYIGSNPAAPHLNAFAFNNGSAPNERARKLPVPFKGRASGLWAMAVIAAAADLILYDGTTPLRTIAMASARRAGTGQAMYAEFFGQDKASYPTLDSLGSYRVGLKPTSVSDVSLYYEQYVNNAVLGGLAGGITSHHSGRSGGAWDDATAGYNTIVPVMGVMIDQLDDGVGGGGGQAAQYPPRLLRP